jgi:hypothetical protein
VFFVVAEDTMGGAVVLHRTETKSDAQKAKASFSRDGCFKRVRLTTEEPTKENGK